MFSEKQIAFLRSDKKDYFAKCIADLMSAVNALEAKGKEIDKKFNAIFTDLPMLKNSFEALEKRVEEINQFMCKGLDRHNERIYDLGRQIEKLERLTQDIATDLNVPRTKKCDAFIADTDQHSCKDGYNAKYCSSCEDRECGDEPVAAPDETWLLRGWKGDNGRFRYIGKTGAVEIVPKDEADLIPSDRLKRAEELLGLANEFVTEKTLRTEIDAFREGSK